MGGVGAPINDSLGSLAELVESNGDSWPESEKAAEDAMQQARLVANDGAAGEELGFSVAFSSDTAVVGSRRGLSAQGAAYVFTRTGSTWTQQARLVADDGTAVDRFGESVALSGNTILVGSVWSDVGATNNQGAAYVFVRTGSTWVQQAKLVADDGGADDLFGVSVALHGNTALVGANGVAGGGAAYVFERSGSTWMQQAKLVAEDRSGGDQFGFVTALFGDTALVGADWDNVGANVDQGSAYVFIRSGTTWTQQAKLIAQDGAANDHFAKSVAVFGDTALIGEPLDDVGANPSQGSAYVFERTGSSWTQAAKLLALDGNPSDRFGFSVAVDGDAVLVGAPYDDNRGSAYVFARSGPTWTQQSKLQSQSGATSAFYGSSVDLDADMALVGAYLEDVGPNVDQGAAYVFVDLEVLPPTEN